MATLALLLSLFAAYIVTTNANDNGLLATKEKQTVQHDLEVLDSRVRRSVDGEYIGTRGKRNMGGVFVQGTRGKRSIDNGSLQNTGQGAPDLVYNLPELSIFKRAPVGFMGMRGKKDFEYSDFSSRSAQLSPQQKGKKLFLNGINRPLKNLNPKRAPSGFMGMRGKKLFVNDMNNKRGPQGFLGVRGKKDIPEIDYNDIENNVQFFENIANDKSLLNELNQIYDLESDEYNKRAPSSGFFGMRGKKLFDDTEYDNNENSESMEKRAPSGFLGMRGKKFTDYLYETPDNDKRAPMGFLGMRGKKDVSSEMDMVKRSSLAGLFGIRGKKQPLNSGFFGMRGKKQPLEFRGKFVGVRGKKVPNGSLRQLELELDDIANNDVRTANLGEFGDDNTVKRAPSGFMGMRGKKWPESTTNEK